nr:DUF6328 family protein [uncultured Duganella sp.]
MNENAGDDDLSDMLAELRVLLLCAQLLTAFLMTLPFSQGFRQIVQSEKWVFLATFLCAVISLVLFTAPAVQHRVVRPLSNRQGFKQLASKQILVGAATLSCALVLGVELVTAEVFGHRLGTILAGLTAVMIGFLWWVWPRSMKKRFSAPDSTFSKEANL